MESSMPFALRVAAGLLSEAVGRARRLPADLTALPVTVIGQVAKFSFELNQQLAELATEGDRLLAGLQADDAPPQRTAWSTIDDEDEVAARDPQAAATWDAADADITDAPVADVSLEVSDIGPDGAVGLVLDDEVPAPAVTPPAVTPLAVPDLGEPDEPVGTPAAPARKPSVRRPGGAGRRVGSAGDSAGERVGGSADEPAGESASTPMDRELLDDVEELEVERPAPLVGLPSGSDAAAAVDIGAMTLAQLRLQVRSWESTEVRAALEQEQRGKARPAFLTVLTNRLSTLARGGA